MRVISWAKAFVVVGRGSSYLFVSMIQNQEFAASLEGGILGEWEWKSKEVKSGRSSTLSSTMADSTKRNLTEDQKKASPWRDSILWTFFYNNFVRPYSSRFSMFAKMSINFCGYTRYIIPGQEDSTLNQEPWSPAQQNSPGCFRVWHETDYDGYLKIECSLFLWVLQMSSCSFLISSSYRGGAMCLQGISARRALKSWLLPLISASDEIDFIPDEVSLPSLPSSKVISMEMIKYAAQICRHRLIYRRGWDAHPIQ